MRVVCSLLLALSILLGLGLPGRAQAFDPLDSVVQLNLADGQGLEGRCSGFVIGASHGYVQTADHCGAPITYAVMDDGTHLYGHIVWHDEALDTEIVEIPALAGRLPSLEPLLGAWDDEPVLMIGYPGGRHPALMILGHGMAVDVRLDKSLGDGKYQIMYRHDENGGWVMVDQAGMKGMSGGPILSVDGKVVGMLQIANTDSAFGRRESVLYAHTSKYWE